MNLTNILKRAVITEKSLQHASKQVLTFEVDRAASKEQIAKAIKDYFNVDVLEVGTVKSAGKPKRVGQRRLLKTTQPTKKALITIKQGQKIDLFEVGEAS